MEAQCCHCRDVTILLLSPSPSATRYNQSPSRFCLPRCPAWGGWAQGPQPLGTPPIPTWCFWVMSSPRGGVVRVAPGTAEAKVAVGGGAAGGWERLAEIPRVHGCGTEWGWGGLLMWVSTVGTEGTPVSLLCPVLGAALGESQGMGTWFALCCFRAWPKTLCVLGGGRWAPS